MANPGADSFYMESYREKTLKIFLCDTRRPRPLIFGMQLHLVCFTKTVQIIALG